MMGLQVTTLNIIAHFYFILFISKYSVALEIVSSAICALSESFEVVPVDFNSSSPQGVSILFSLRDMKMMLLFSDFQGLTVAQ